MEETRSQGGRTKRPAGGPRSDLRHRLREAGAEYRVGRVASRRGGPGRDADRRRVILDLMRSALGAPLTAAITGVGSATAVNGLVDGRSSFDDELDQRLRAELAEWLRGDPSAGAYPEPVRAEVVAFIAGTEGEERRA